MSLSETAGFTNPAAIPYNSAGLRVEVVTDWTAIFTNNQPTDCPLTQCELMDSSCSSSSTSLNVGLTSSPSYGITGSETNPVGYSEQVCFRCGVQPAGQAEIFFDKQITISGSALDCSASLSENTGLILQDVIYNSIGSTISVVNSYLDVFTHS